MPLDFSRPSGRPDLVFLMTDQHRWDALGVQNPLVLTPNLDRLVREGTLFEQAVCQAPMCIPSRLSMMTGLYPSQLGVRSNDDNTPDDENLPGTLLPEALRRGGYLTAGFGKTHWGKTQRTPSTRGFDVRVVGCREVGEEISARYWQDDENAEGLARYRQETEYYGPGEEEVPGYIGTTSKVVERDHRDGWVAERCLEWLGSADLETGAPLFLYLSFLKPHAGLNPPARYEAMYDIAQIPDIPQPPWKQETGTHLAVCDAHNAFLGRRARRWRQAWQKLSPLERRRTTLRYWANCTWLDDLFGQVLQRLRERGRLEDAVILFASDHGELLGERNHRFSKYCLYDSSVRVPLILSGSALPKEMRGKRDSRPAELVDIYPTLAQVAGARGPSGSLGESLFEPGRRKGTFAEFHDAGAPAWMWRTDRHKLILFSDPASREMRGELYDLERDPHEWRNLFATEALLRERLMEELSGQAEMAGIPLGTAA